ncbi:L-histidine N(alpha)-methyltransferase [Candidatus Nitrotoga sp. M5]|uniref:L-histidine N(alpha)-methyltransferase n=1 Tax=Candidatus Nitrotoga sp. M5 TaxID=2890409 RepID=UPI001EF24761|nr:L-histidine N(alpha)-methyltransferase [Candidatus Nitrotoga sp. M5]CAH1385502.1 Dimethylhistidine N-methyltransferase [Candidatus Nitrotoga sp. M5]
MKQTATLKNVSPIDEAMLEDIVTGLSQTQKTLPCKYFYNDIGSKLFEEITQLDEYYVTRAELAILDLHIEEIQQRLQNLTAIIEPGSGAGIKIQKLLSACSNIEQFILLEISPEILNASAKTIQEKFPSLNVRSLIGDFTNEALILKLIKEEKLNQTSNLIFFPGSTIGNFSSEKVPEILHTFKKLSGNNGKILIGFDLLKDKERLIAAYSDSKGITAQFNKNILSRINDELDADFDVNSGFSHLAIYNENKARIEMHLASTRDQSVTCADKIFHFAKGETIHTESSHKYSIESFSKLAKNANLNIEAYWTDPENQFALILLVQE